LDSLRAVTSVAPIPTFSDKEMNERLLFALRHNTPPLSESFELIFVESKRRPDFLLNLFEKKVVGKESKNLAANRF
jgi:hypothetical protein